MVGRTGRRVAAVAAFALAAPGAADASYSLVPSPNGFADNNVLNGVSASSSSDAWAVGSLCCSARHSGLGSLTEHWNGSAWSIVPSPDTLLFDEVLTGVASISPTNAWAVGERNQSGFKSRNPFLAHWNGSAWSTVTPPAGVTGQLAAVSADSAGDVWAVGDDQHGHPVVLRFNGVSWTSVAAPGSTGSQVLTGVKAFSPTNVWAVGSTVSGGVTPVGKTLVLHWNGSTWFTVVSPNPDAKANVLMAVGGAAANDLWAVGSKGQSETTTGVPPGTRTLAIHFNGSAWSAVASPSVGDEDILTGVAAPTSHNVAAVGSDDNTSGSIPVARTLAETWSGASWSFAATPNVGSTDNLLKGVAAIPGTTSVWAVGFHLTTGGPDGTVILRGS
jgi:hypothetical protein